MGSFGSFIHSDHMCDFRLKFYSEHFKMYFWNYFIIQTNKTEKETLKVCHLRLQCILQ